jgi:hypothetical protein
MADAEQDAKQRQVIASTLPEGMAKEQMQPQRPDEPTQQQLLKDLETREQAKDKRDALYAAAALNNPASGAEQLRDALAADNAALVEARLKQAQQSGKTPEQQATQPATPATGYQAYANEPAKEQDKLTAPEAAQRRDHSYSAQTQLQTQSTDDHAQRAQDAAKRETERQAKAAALELTKANQTDATQPMTAQQAQYQKRQKQVAQPAPTHAPTDHEAQRAVAYYAARRDAQTNRHAPLREMTEHQQRQFDRRAQMPLRETTDKQQATAVANKDRRHEKDGNGR